jgi:hypothetical protein
MIVVHCDRCGINYDLADVCNETTHPAARHVARFDCPRGHRSEARRMLYQPSIRFEAGNPDDRRQSVSPDAVFLRACGVRPPEMCR